MLRFSLVLLLVITASPIFAGDQDIGGSKSASGWDQLKIGGGGFVTRIEIAPDGTQVARSDTAGPWVRSSYSQSWTPVVSFPGVRGGFPDAAPGAYAPACEISIAPSNTQHLYMW